MDWISDITTTKKRPNKHSQVEPDGPSTGPYTDRPPHTVIRTGTIIKIAPFTTVCRDNTSSLYSNISGQSLRRRIATVYDRKRLYFNDSTVRITVCGGRSVYGPVSFDLGCLSCDNAIVYRRLVHTGSNTSEQLSAKKCRVEKREKMGIESSFV